MGTSTEKEPPSSQLQRQLRRFVVFHYDFEQVKEYANVLQARTEYGADTINRALTVTIIMAYCRPFSGNSDGKIPGRVTNQFLPDEQALHEKLIRKHGLRNSLYAHSDHTAHDLAVSVTEVRGVKLVLPIGSDPYGLLPNNEVKRLAGMANKIQARLAEMQASLQQKLDAGVPF
jgi:alpha-L-fucosidase